MGKTRVAVVQLEQKLLDHTVQDAKNFDAIERTLHNMDTKLDTVVVAVAKLETINEIAAKAGETAGHSAGRSTALRWTTPIASVVAAAIAFLANSCAGTHLPIPTAPASVAAPVLPHE